MDSEQLQRLLSVQMPYGKYQGRCIADLPGHYLMWMAREGFPRGDLGRLLALMYELDHNGLAHLLEPLRRSGRGAGAAVEGRASGTGAPAAQ